MSTSESSPSKKKTNDDARWRANWWDLHPLVEDLRRYINIFASVSHAALTRHRRPVAWSSSSTIFTAHPTQPILFGRLFPSSKQFLVVSPDPILRSPASYGSPTVISVSPNDHWLFAFFPGHESDGIACIWSRGSCVDAWIVKEYWPFSRGAGVITCAWAGTELVNLCRWFIVSSPISGPTYASVKPNSSTRNAGTPTSCLLPPHLSPVLQNVTVFIDSALFHRRGSTTRGDARHPGWPQDLEIMRLRRYRIYLRRVIHSGRHEVQEISHLRQLEIGCTPRPRPWYLIRYSAVAGPISRGTYPILEWGAQAEEQTIELCEVKLRFDGMYMSMISQPLPPLYHPFPRMSSLTFICSPPPKPDPSASPRTSPKSNKQPVRPVEPPPTFLVASFLDFEEYSTVPKSAVVAYTLARAPSSAALTKTTWTTHQVGERSFFPHVLVLSCPPCVSTLPQKRGLIALLANASGPMTRRSHNAMEVVVGNIVILRVPDLTGDPDWEQLPIMAPISRAGMDWPINMMGSMNQILLCTIALCRMSIHTLPKQLTKVSVSGNSASRNISPLSMMLVASLQSRRSIADIAHILAVPAVPLDTVVDTLRGAWSAFEINVRAGLVGAFSVADVLGATVELYRTRARLLEDDDEKDLLSSLWRNAHSMCSVIACLAAFEDCKEPEGYDLEAIWQLVSLSGWAVSFLETLMKECLFAADLVDLTPSTDEWQPKPEPVDDTDVLALDESKRPPSSPFDSPLFLHLTHPFMLTNIIGMIMHVNRFYHSLSALTPKGENSQIARDILMDVIGCSGLDLKGIEEILKGAMLDVRSITGDEARLSLAKCHLVPAQYPFLRKIVHALYTSTAIDKPRLYIKAADLVDAFTNLSTFEQSKKEQDRDVVTKGQG
ncbi:hypothetical protein JVT61DRAFT_2317 [Boletus reticuloceps]|uniref:Mediator of RNA polymerase II transcription subunit 16 n=1 Tax=Boletus reticuloceps TaxID=495285 RepID=A0A8I3A903_9AGAM|nr:hypothetical protein JVT61DRAFT_2317 [Boletus reticuloceps]